MVLERLRHHPHYFDASGDTSLSDSVEAYVTNQPSVFNGVGEPVLCHGDVHPEYHGQAATGGMLGNAFEHALVAPAEYDYWQAVMPYFEANDVISEDVTQAF